MSRILNHELIAQLDFKQPYVWLATWFGFGLMRKAPGTWGTVGALPFGVLLQAFGGWPVLLAATVIVTAIGWWAADKFEQATGLHDAGAVVIDEAAGIWLTLLVATTSLLSIVLAFVLFRFFDIVKPWPVSWCDRQPGATGVMIDDLVAGVLAALCLVVLQYVGIG